MIIICFLVIVSLGDLIFHFLWLYSKSIKFHCIWMCHSFHINLILFPSSISSILLLPWARPIYLFVPMLIHNYSLGMLLPWTISSLISRFVNLFALNMLLLFLYFTLSYQRDPFFLALTLICDSSIQKHPRLLTPHFGYHFFLFILISL